MAKGLKKFKSIARLATRGIFMGKAKTPDGVKARIRSLRGAFKYLPVYFSSDIVHGSWWYVGGSLISTLIPVVPLVDIYAPVFQKNSQPTLSEFNEAGTWILLILSGLFYTLGSYAFVRAFDVDPENPDSHRKPLFTWHHIGTDELLGAWLFFWAAVPSVPYSGIFLYDEPGQLTYWANFVASILFVVASFAFVYVCYPSNHHLMEHSVPLVLPLVQKCCGANANLCRHVANDWLAATWFFFYLTLLWFLGSCFFLGAAANDRQVFVWSTSLLDAFVFLVGGAYMCAGALVSFVWSMYGTIGPIAALCTGSYPPVNIDEHVDHDTPDILAETFNPVLGDSSATEGRDDMADERAISSNDDVLPLERVPSAQTRIEQVEITSPTPSTDRVRPNKDFSYKHLLDTELMEFESSPNV